MGSEVPYRTIQVSGTANLFPTANHDGVYEFQRKPRHFGPQPEHNVRFVCPGASGGTIELIRTPRGTEGERMWRIRSSTGTVGGSGDTNLFPTYSSSPTLSDSPSVGPTNCPNN